MKNRSHTRKNDRYGPRSCALRSHVIGKLRFARYSSGWGIGDVVYACNASSGNCSDFHSYFIALAREAGDTARFAIVAAIPSERNDGGIDGYLFRRGAQE